MESILVATVLMGLLTLAVALYVVRGMEWKSNRFVPGNGDRDTWETLDAATHHPATWALGFFALVFGTIAFAMIAVGAIELPFNLGLGAIVAPFAVMIVLFVGLGTYGALRAHQRSTAEATVVSLLVLGTLFLLAVTANLALG